MPPTEPIVCRPTSWFRFRAGIILVMFAVFAVLFYMDGTTGYRKKNKVYFLHQCFKDASQKFSELNADQSLTPEKWSEFATGQQVQFPADLSILPSDLNPPLPWPAILADHERMKSLQWNQLWLEYTKEQGMDSTPPEKVYDARAIREQWIFFYICSGLAAVSLLILIRTSRRSIIADDEELISQDGRKIPYSDFNRLDLRKWDNKGIAFAEYDGVSGKGRVRIDGLTYGGFKKDNGQPAEMLMQRLRSRFSGELLEYVSVTDDSDQDGRGKSTQKAPKTHPRA